MLHVFYHKTGEKEVNYSYHRIISDKSVTKRLKIKSVQNTWVIYEDVIQMTNEHIFKMLNSDNPPSRTNK